MVSGASGGIASDGRRRRAWLLALCVVVLLAAAGGAAVFFLRHPHWSAAAASGPSPAASGPSPAASGPSPAVSHRSATPGPRVSASATLPPAQLGVGGVTVGMSAVNTDPQAAAVARTIGTYFADINSGDYSHAWNIYAPAEQAAIPYQAWASGLSTTHDSRIAVVSIRHNAGGGVAATVTFTSHQSPQDGPSPGETCTRWSLNYHLAPSPPGSGTTPYLIKKAKAVGRGHVPC